MSQRAGLARLIDIGSNEANMLRGLILVVTLAAASNAFAGAPTNAAHDLAQKFSGQVEKAVAPADAAAAQPAPAKLQPAPAKLQPAQAKPRDTSTAKPKAAAHEKSTTTAEQAPVVKPFAKPAADQAVAQIAASERPPLDYEMDMLRRARAEQADRKSAEKPVQTAAPAKIFVTPPTATPPPPTAKPDAAPIAPAAPAKPEPPKAAEAPAAAATATTKPAPSGAAPAVAATITPPPGPAVQASVLLAIETGGASSKGDSATLDPIICVGDHCFLSAGLTADAVKLSKADALKLKSSNDASPDACRGKVGCVFRNVGLAKNALIEVIEIGSHPSALAQTYSAEPDATCKTSDGALACENPIATADFRIWIVPEAIAKTAGVEAIEDAVADSLPHRDIARDTDK